MSPFFRGSVRPAKRHPRSWSLNPRLNPDLPPKGHARISILGLPSFETGVDLPVFNTLYPRPSRDELAPVVDKPVVVVVVVAAAAAAAAVGGRDAVGHNYADASQQLGGARVRHEEEEEEEDDDDDDFVVPRDDVAAQPARVTGPSQPPDDAAQAPEHSSKEPAAAPVEDVSDEARDAVSPALSTVPVLQEHGSLEVELPIANDFADQGSPGDDSSSRSTVGNSLMHATHVGARETVGTATGGLGEGDGMGVQGTREPQHEHPTGDDAVKPLLPFRPAEREIEPETLTEPLTAISRGAGHDERPLHDVDPGGLAVDHEEEAALGPAGLGPLPVITEEGPAREDAAPTVHGETAMRDDHEFVGELSPRRSSSLSPLTPIEETSEFVEGPTSGDQAAVGDDSSHHSEDALQTQGLDDAGWTPLNETPEILGEAMTSEQTSTSGHEDPAVVDVNAASEDQMRSEEHGPGGLNSVDETPEVPGAPEIREAASAANDEEPLPELSPDDDISPTEETVNESLEPAVDKPEIIKEPSAVGRLATTSHEGPAAYDTASHRNEQDFREANTVSERAPAVETPEAGKGSILTDDYALGDVDARDSTEGASPETSDLHDSKPIVVNGTPRALREMASGDTVVPDHYSAFNDAATPEQGPDRADVKPLAHAASGFFVMRTSTGQNLSHDDSGKVNEVPTPFETPFETPLETPGRLQSFASEESTPFETSFETPRAMPFWAPTSAAAHHELEPYLDEYDDDDDDDEPAEAPFILRHSYIQQLDGPAWGRDSDDLERQQTPSISVGSASVADSAADVEPLITDEQLDVSDEFRPRGKDLLA